MAPLEAELAALIAQLEPRARQTLARTIAKTLRADQQQRIRAQRNPDGSPYVPRKPQRRQRGRIRNQMFTKLRQARYLQTQSTASQATVAFAGRVQKIARVHQLGLPDRPSRFADFKVAYPSRALLGFDAAAIEHIKNHILDHLAR